MLRTFVATLRAQWMGALALFLVIAGGTAYAANTVGSSDIIDESILSQDLKNGEVKSVDIGNNQVTSADVKNDTLPNGGLTADDLATDSVNATEVADSSIDSGEIVDNSLFDSDLAANSVGASELQDGVVTGVEVANNSLTTADIAGADVNGGHISIGGGSVGNARCKQFEASVGGAKAGEAVVFSAQGALQNGIVIYGQRVPTDGHVTFDVCNFSGTIQDAITNFPVRVITFG